ncbi:hypothetical protein N8I77_005718 [Diaporthe amygdali]|uniref:Uncharacterized protein n=1 Tax=Phomopsis amygdali TaxID=1214568 RepID=A0AAD9SGH2_PHOAM|nr:hypothetical protein N8I77_005718 [Diaporthe amygdali]
MWPTSNARVGDGKETNELSTSGKEDGHTNTGYRTDLSGEAHPTFETLPPELRSQILLNVRDLRTLKSLVRASPTYHEHYRLDRDSFLQNCLGSELDGFYVDALATFHSRVRQLGQQRSDEIIKAFLNSYRCWISGPGTIANVPLINSSDIQWLCAFHLTVALPLADSFCQWALFNLKRAAVSSAEGPVHEEPQLAMELSTPTKSERTRVLRALYRCETYAHLFGRNDGNRIGMFRHSEITEIFFNIFEPWEAEEVGCIDYFIRSKYTDIFNEVKADLHPDSPRFDDDRGPGCCPDPDGSYELDTFWNDYMEGTIERGVKMTARILAIDKHDQLVDKMARCLTSRQWLDASIKESLDTIAQLDRREDLNHIPNVKDEAEGLDPLLFRGDTVPPKGPPLAWVLLWEGQYVNIFGGYVPELLKACGWVMWDERRLTNTAVRKLIADQWKTAPMLVEEIVQDYPWLSGIGESADTPS